MRVSWQGSLSPQHKIDLTVGLRDEARGTLPSPWTPEAVHINMNRLPRV